LSSLGQGSSKLKIPTSTHSENTNIYAQRYSADGTPQGGEFRVNTTTALGEDSPSIALDADGDFLIAWARFEQTENTNIYAQRYSADGATLGSEFRVNTTTANEQFSPSVGLDADGDFVIAWTRNDDQNHVDIFAQRYSANGTPLDGEFQINTTFVSLGTNISDVTLAVAMDADGDFVAVWDDGFDIVFQRYNNLGESEGDETVVPNGPDGNAEPTVAMDAEGNFVIAWTRFGEDVIYAQRYDAAGLTQGSIFQVVPTTVNQQHTPAAAMDADGDFTIAWASELQDGDQGGIYAQRFAGPEDVDLSVVVTDDLDLVDPGGLLNYDFIVTNNHPIVTPTGVPAIDRAIGTSTGINTSHTLPEGVSLNAFNGNDWTCTQTARTARQVDCAFSGNLLPTTATSADLTLSFETTAPAATELGITTIVNVTGNQIDADLTNNTDTEETQVRAPDTRPDEEGEDPLGDFEAQPNVAPNTLVTSNEITVTGIDAPAPISILGVAGAAYSINDGINDGPFTSSAGTVEVGNTVTVQQTSWSDFSTTTNAILVIGGVTRTFSVSTAPSTSGSASTTTDDSTDEPAQETGTTPATTTDNQTEQATQTTVDATDDPIETSPDAVPDTVSADEGGGSGGGCTTLAGNPAAGGIGWAEIAGLFLFAAIRRRA
jgi:hypothetical protein